MAQDRNSASSYHQPNLFTKDTTPHHAAEFGCVKTLQNIIDVGRQERGVPPLVVLEERHELLQCVPLHVAAERGHLEIVQFIMSHEVDVDAPDGHQVRPLHLAAINNHCPVVKALVDKGANVTKQDSEGDLPTHWAATKGHVEMLEMLLERGAPVDAHNKAGWTALHRAAYNGRVLACQLLLRRGASIHAVTKAGATPLHLAAYNNQLGTMEFLLKLGASTHFKDQQGATVADVCIADAARWLIAEKAAAQRQAMDSHGSSSSSSSRPATTAVKAGVAATGCNITRVPLMPRFTPAANNNLDADGFPTASDELSGLCAEASDHDPVGGPTQILVLDQDVAGGLADVAVATAAVSVVAVPAANPPITSKASFKGTGRPGQLSRQASQQQHSRRLSTSGGTSLERKSIDTMQQHASWLSGKSKPAGPMQKFLKQYSLDRKGLFAKP